MATTLTTEIDSSELEQLAKRVDAGKRQVDGGRATIAEALSLAQERYVSVGREGKFSAWLKARCKISHRAAYDYIGAWRTFLIVRRDCTIQPSAMYLLANCPKAAQKALQLDKIGKHVDKKKALELRRESGEEPKKSPERPALAGDSLDSPEGQTQSEPVPLGAGDESLAEYTCPNCGNHKDDEDGDCAKCGEPKVAPPADEPAPESGGFEPAEARKSLDKIKTLLGKVSREYPEAVKILGQSVESQAFFAAFDDTSVAFDRWQMAALK